MFNLLRDFLKTRRGSLVENIIYIIIIGALSFTFYAEKFKEPMVSQMESLNGRIETWTNTTGIQGQ